MFGEIITHELKLQAMENVSKFQIGAISGHRAQEHLFTIKSVISLYISQGKGLILSLYDISKYFDRENLKDCMGELYKANVKGKLYRLIYTLNKDTEVSVKTPVGITESAAVGEGLGQGTNEGAIVSSINLDGGVKESFEDSDKEVLYIDVKVNPCLFQDDIARLAENIDSVKEGNRRLETMAETKLLDYNIDKSNSIIIGSRKFRKNIKEKLETNPLMFCGKTMKISESDIKYLGDYLSFSLAESVFTTVQKRKGLTMRQISEIRITIEDIRSNQLGGILTGIDIWNLAVVPFLYNNSECCVDIPKKAMNVLNSIQNTFFVSLFGTSKGCPIPILYWDTGILTPENLIIYKKLLFNHHLNQLSDDCLAKEILVIQKENELPGLAKECTEYMSELGIDSDPSDNTKTQWKKICKNRIHEKNRTELLTRISSYKKLDYSRICEEQYGLHPYLSSMNLSFARTFFASRSHMLRTVQMNFKRKTTFAANLYKCTCMEDDYQEHLISCPSYAHLREGLDLEGSDTDLVRYYQRVISDREQREERGET